jgi:putative transposase
VIGDCGIIDTRENNEKIGVDPITISKYINELQGTKEKEESKGRKWARTKLALLQQHIHNIREDYLHKLSKKLIDENQVICIEDLSVNNMLANVPADKRKQYRWEEKKHHREIADAGWRGFRTKLEYKSVWYGRNLVKVDRYYPSSQICNKCKWQYHDLPKNCKEWCCWNCFDWNNRDDNAALNIVDEGLKVFLGIENQADCPDVRPAVKSGLLVGSETQRSLAAG